MTQATENQPGSGGSGFARQWHHRPPVPVKVSPFFFWPPEPVRMVRWVADRWFSIA
jgi:lathosterol oxidase